MKELKFLYETTVKRMVDEPTVETREENGEKIEIKRTVKKAKPIKVAILKPDRKLFKGAEVFYAKTLSDFLKAGLLPYSLVSKRYANDGGPLTENEKTRLKELREEARKHERDFYSIQGNEPAQQDKKNELLVRINAINAEVSNIQNSYSDIFDCTAEMKSRNETIEWWALFLTYADLDGTGYKPLFGDGEYDVRVSKLEEYEDAADPFTIEVIKRLSYLISFWFTARDTVTSIDFGTMEKLYVDTMSDYKTDEVTEEKIVEVPKVETPTVEAPKTETVTPTP